MDWVKDLDLASPYTPKPKGPSPLWGGIFFVRRDPAKVRKRWKAKGRKPWYLLNMLPGQNFKSGVEDFRAGGSGAFVGNLDAFSRMRSGVRCHGKSQGFSGLHLPQQL